MSKPKFTPGPWTVEEENVNTFEVLADTDSDDGALVIAETITNKANAQLIAAAPELLEALQWALHHIEETHGIRGDTLDPIRSAIAKATGGIK